MPKNTIIALLSLAVVTLGYLLHAQEPAAKATPATPAAPTLPALGQVLTELSADPALTHTLVGFCLLNAEGQTVATLNAQDALIPASSLKTLTTATALEVLGPEFTFTTELRATAPIDETGTLDGDLVIRGGGDPTLTYQALPHFEAFIQETGLKSITGRIIGDATHLPEQIAGDFWDWSDVGNGYGAPISGLNFERNRYTAHFGAGQEEGDPAKLLKTTPDLPGVTVTNRVLTGPADSGDRVQLYGGPFATTIHAHGTIPLRSQDFQVSGAVPDPALVAAHFVHEGLTVHGVTIGGDPVAEYHTPTKAEHVLHTHQSQPLPEIIVHLHDVSDNLEAEALYRAIGRKAGSDPATAIRAHWKKRGLNLPSLRLVDGSGLGRANTISAHDLARLQHTARQGPHGRLFHDSLISAMDGRLRYKPGAMSGIHTFCGFVENAEGEELSFALLFNHAPDRRTTSTWTNRLLQSATQ